MKLRQPIQAHGKEISELTFRKPLGKDIRKNGMPIKIEITKAGTQIQIIDAEAMAAHISDLAGIPPSSVDAMDPIDFTEASTIVGGFFNQEPPSSTGTGNSPGSSTE
jgi:hypothetical protein